LPESGVFSERLVCAGGDLLSLLAFNAFGLALGSSLGNGAAIAPSPNHEIIVPDRSSFPCWHVSSDVSESFARVVCRCVFSRQRICCNAAAMNNERASNFMGHRSTI